MISNFERCWATAMVVAVAIYGLVIVLSANGSSRASALVTPMLAVTASMLILTVLGFIWLS